jgi:hypothetical protein
VHFSSTRITRAADDGFCEHVDKSRVENVSAEGLFDLLPGGIVMLLIRISKLFNTCKAGSLSSTPTFPLAYRRLRRGSAFELSLVPELQSARRQRPCRFLAYPKTDAGDKRKAITARPKVCDYVEEIRDGRPLSPSGGV